MVNVGKNMGKLELLCVGGGNVKWYSTVANNMVVPQKIKHRITLWLSNSTSGYGFPLGLSW